MNLINKFICLFYFLIFSLLDGVGFNGISKRSSCDSLKLVERFDIQGVKLDYVMGNPFLDGFDVNNEYFYFLGGSPTVLSIYRGEERIKNQLISNHSGGKLHFFDGVLYFFDNKLLSSHNLLTKIDINTGDVLFQEKIIENTVSSYHFQDSLLVLEVFDPGNSFSISDDLPSLSYNLKSGEIKRIANSFNLSETLINNEVGPDFHHFLGLWKNDFVFVEITDLESDDFDLYAVFTLVDSLGTKLSSKTYNLEEFGGILYPNWDEYFKLCNDQIYYVGMGSSSLIINKISLKGLFDKRVDKRLDNLINKKTSFSESDLIGLKKYELGILRNSIFAKYGYIFKSRDLNDFFIKKEWYSPLYENVDSLLTESELESISLILEKERNMETICSQTH